jgi:hypothetical protein
VLFVIGSYDFFDDVGDSVLGAWMFIVGGTIVAVLSVLSLVETYMHHSHGQEEEDESSSSSDDDSGVVVCSPVSQAVEFMGGPRLDNDAKREVEEESLYLVSSLIFMAGCWLGYVKKRQSEGEKEHWEALSVWLFIVGSFGFLMGSFYNALGLNTSGPSSRSSAAKLAVYALLCGLVGSLFFFTGSYLYRPGLGTGCTLSEAEEQEAEGEVGCVTASQTGTWLYVLGSLVFVVQSLLNLLSAVIKHHEEDKVLRNPVLISALGRGGGKGGGGTGQGHYGAVPTTTPQVNV